MRHLPLVVAGVFGLGLAACRSTELNKEHCENNDPDGLGCVDGGSMSGEGSGSMSGPTGDSATADADSDTGMTMGMPNDTTGSTDDGPAGCATDDECTEADAPFCVDLLCSPCSASDDPDAACAEKFPDTRACVASTCVECSEDTHCTDAAAPICDTTTNSCVPCTWHDQCPGEAACHLVTGECFPADEVYYIDSAAACPGDGTMASPWCLVQSHIDELPVAGARTFHLAAGNTNSENLLITGDRRVALLGDLAAPAAFTPPGSDQSYRLDIAGGNTAVFTDATEISGNVNFVAVRVDDATFYATRTAIVQNYPGGIVAQNGAELYVRNGILGRNGADFSDSPAISASSSTVEIVYTTIAANDGNAPQSLSCDANVTGQVRNSIVVGIATDSIACDGVEFTNSLVDTAGLGASNVVENLSPAWFPNIAMADFHVAPTGPFDGLAIWEADDPLTDVDGDARPNTDGASDFAGADVP